MDRDLDTAHPHGDAPAVYDTSRVEEPVPTAEDPEPGQIIPRRLSVVACGSMESVAGSTTPSSAGSAVGSSSASSSAYSHDWAPAPKKQPSSLGSVTVSSMSTADSRRKPDGKLRIRTLCLLGALLPGIGCYFCVAYTYLFQLDRVRNFTSTNCPDVKSSFPPISYSIGVWTPQKYVWLVVLALHMPPRFLYGVAYKNQYTFGQSVHKDMWWFPVLTRVHVRLMFVEALGLILVSVLDIEFNFAIHAACYALWIVCLNFNMLFNTILQHYSGIRDMTKHHATTFYVKCGLFALVYPLSVSTGFSYGIYFAYCNAAAYAAFSIAEYVIVGVNSVFYFTLIYELRGSHLEIHVCHKRDVFGCGHEVPASPDAVAPTLV